MKKILRIFLLVLMISSFGTLTASAAKNGILTENGKQYYYVNGVKIKDKLGIKIGKSYYKITKLGVVKQVTQVQGLAGIYAEKYDRDLKKAFMAIAKMKYTEPNPSRIKTDADKAVFGFTTNSGNCNVQALCFSYVAKALGYKGVVYQKGYIKTASGLGGHAWVTIKNGTTVDVYDPSLAQHFYVNNQKKNMKCAFQFRYGAKNTYTYYGTDKKKKS